MATTATPRPRAAAPTPPAPALPSPPALPQHWTQATIVSYVGGLAVFVLGLLTATGVIPAGNTTVQIIVGSLTALLGSVGTQTATIVRASLQKAALKAGHPVADLAQL